MGDILQFATAVAYAGRTILIVIGQEQLDLETLGLTGARRTRLDRHAFDHRGVAGGGKLGGGGARKLELDQTDAAGARRVVDVVELA